MNFLSAGRPLNCQSAGSYSEITSTQQVDHFNILWRWIIYLFINLKKQPFIMLIFTFMLTGTLTVHKTYKHSTLAQSLDWRTFHFLFETDTVGVQVLRIEKLLSLDFSIAAHSVLCLIVKCNWWVNMHAWV